MAYSVNTISSISEIPALWAAFANAQGWIVDTSVAGAPTIKHPTYAGAIPFRMRTTISGNNHDILVDSTNSVVTAASVTRSPNLNPTQVTNGQAAVLPTKVHFIGRGTGTPFVATIVEYGFNLYRQIYTGYMEKSSNYDGGEVISGSSFFHTDRMANGDGLTAIRRGYLSPLFTARSDTDANVAEVGGVRIIHANNPTAWRRFSINGFGDATTGIDNFGSGNRNLTVMGGYFDSVGSGYGIAGKSNFTSSAVVAPVNLVITKNVLSKTKFQHVGKPTGVRFINMENFEPGVEVTVGSKTYRVFPCASKKSTTTFNAASALAGASCRPNAESSYYMGFAFEVN